MSAYVFRRLSGCVLALALVGGCAPDVPTLHAPLCAAADARDQGSRVPDLSTAVPCSGPHIYEVYDVATLPAAALDGSDADAQMANRDDLALPRVLPDDSAERVVYEDFAGRTCTSSLQRTTGYDSLTINGKSATRVGLLPALSGISAPRYSVPPERYWLAGQRQVLCSARLARPVQSATGQVLLLSRARSSDFPIQMRACRGYDAARQRIEAAPCSKPHVSETLFFFQADRAFGKEFVENLIATKDPAGFDRFDQACSQTLPALLGKNYDKQLRGFGSVPRRWTEADKTVRCEVGPVHFQTTDLPAGSLVGANNAKVALQPTNPAETP
jgi:hypothetical protein